MRPTTHTGFRLDDGQIEVVDPFVAKCLRERTIAERAAMAFETEGIRREFIRAGVRSRYPDWTDQQVAAEIVRRIRHAVG